MHYIKKLIKSLLRHKIYINFSPTSYIPSFTINISFLSAFLISIIFIVFISFSMFDYFKTADYYALKIENRILKNKIDKILVTARESLDYLNFAKRTSKQIAKITDSDINKESSLNGIGGPQYSESLKLRNIIENIDYSKLDEKEIINAYDNIKNESQQLLTNYNELLNYITTKLNHQKSLPSDWPVIGNITSPYGYRIHPFTLSYDFHSGVDIANKPGSDIHVTADGVVRYTGWAMGYGLCVIVDHGFGYSTLYGHLSQSLVKDGEVVKRGEVIAKLGSTGTSTGPHLHYEVWEYGSTKNPSKFLHNTIAKR